MAENAIEMSLEDSWTSMNRSIWSKAESTAFEEDYMSIGVTIHG